MARKKASANTPSAEDLYTNGIGEAHKGDWKAAAKCFKAATAASPEHFRAWENLGVAHVSLNQIDLAIKAFQKAIEVNPKLISSYINLSNIYQSCGQNQQAIDILHMALEIEPLHREALMSLGKAYLHDDNPRSAVTAFKQILNSIDSKDYEAANLMGVACLNCGLLEEAAKWFTEAILRNPDFTGAYANFGIVLLALGRIAEAVHILRITAKVTPSHAQTWNNLGVAYIRAGAFEQAASALEKAVVLRPNLAETHESLGHALEGLAEQRKQRGEELADVLDRAESAYLTALSMNPYETTLYTKLGKLYKQQGRKKDAIKIYKKGVKIDPTYFDFHFNLKELGYKRPKG